jgi:hypothetical protein
VSRPQPPRRSAPPGLAAAAVCLFCLLATLYSLYTTIPYGGFSPEGILFAFFALIFAALWWTSRRKAA